MPLPILRLKSDRDMHLWNHHHAIFQTAVEQYPDCEDGSIVEVQAHNGNFLCYATLNRQAYICGRAIAFHEGDPMELLREKILAAVRLRSSLLPTIDATAYRLINAEGDGIPGLIVDRYGDVLVLQCTTLGMDKLRMWIVDLLMKECAPGAIYEKSTGSARKKEGLGDQEGWVMSSGEDIVEVTERGLKYTVSLSGSQKTGLFLDQREMRSLVRNVAKGRTVLDVCAYIGGFSISALAGGAKTCDAVDYDAAALVTAKSHAQRNGLPVDALTTHSEDAFDFLRRRPLPRNYDLIILDPPAFAKRSSDGEQAKRAYTDLNRLAMEAIKGSGFLLTCSCSYQIDPVTFQTIVFHAAKQAKRFVRILGRHRQAVDHPISIYHPEGDYLKSLLLWVE